MLKKICFSSIALSSQPAVSFSNSNQLCSDSYLPTKPFLSFDTVAIQILVTLFNPDVPTCSINLPDLLPNLPCPTITSQTALSSRMLYLPHACNVPLPPQTKKKIKNRSSNLQKKEKMSKNSETRKNKKAHKKLNNVRKNHKKMNKTKGSRALQCSVSSPHAVYFNTDFTFTCSPPVRSSQEGGVAKSCYFSYSEYSTTQPAVHI